MEFGDACGIGYPSLSQLFLYFQVLLLFFVFVFFELLDEPSCFWPSLIP